MHRCVLSYALPARAPSVFLPRKTGSSLSLWPLVARTWRTYGTAIEQTHGDGGYRPFQWKEEGNVRNDLARAQDDSQPERQLEDSSGENIESEDALEFILQGYESQPEHFQRSKPRRDEESEQTTNGPDLTTSRSPLLGRQSTLEKRIARAGDQRAEGGNNRVPENVAPRSAPSPAKRRLRSVHAARMTMARPRTDMFWARSKHVSLMTEGPRSTAFRTAWNARFARIHSQYDESQASTYLKDPPVLHARTEDWIGIIRGRLSADQEMSLESIKAGNRVSSDTIWMNAALWMAQHDQDLLVDFLLRTLEKPEPPATWIADCLTLLALHHARLGAGGHAPVVKLITCFSRLAASLERTHITMDGRFFSKLIPMCTPDQVNALYHALKTGNVRTHWQTYLHIASYFAKNEHFNQGLDAILEAHRGHARVDSPAFRSVCATLLRKSMEQPGGLRACLRIVDNLVKIGLRLNIQLCNIVMLNAVEAGDLKTAFAIYHSLVEHRVHADKYTYAILLKGCKQDLGDTETLLSTIRAAIANTDVLSSPVLATEILHALAVHHTNNDRETAWPTICQAYAQLFNFEPLLDLGLPIPTAIQTSSPPKPPLPPPPHALAIMLQAHLSLLPLTPTSLAHAQTIYTTFLNLMSTAPPTSVFSGLQTSDHIPNAFLALFARHRKTLLTSAKIIKDMQTLPHLPQPTVYSWSIFLHGFTQHGQMKLAEQVLSYMRGKGLEPNEVTWNTLLGGYAAGQDLDGLVDAVARAERGGLVWSEWTKGNVGRLKDRAGLEEALRRRGGGDVVLDFTSDLREGLVGRLESQRQLPEEVEGLVEGRNDG